MKQRKVFNRRFWVAALMMGLVSGWQSPAHGYFEDLGLGVRAAGMGEAFAAVADDLTTVLYNPAGLGILEKNEITAMYSDLYSNLNARLYDGSVDSLGYHNLGLAVPLGQARRSLAGFWTTFRSALYQENVFILGYGVDMTQLLELSEDFQFAVGLNAKLLEWQVNENQYTATNPALNSGELSKLGATADVGGLVIFKNAWRFGASALNLIPVDMGVTTQEVIPVILKLGAAYPLAFKDFGYISSVMPALDLTYRDSQFDLRGGLEAWGLGDYVALRLGSTLDQFATGMSLRLALSNPRLEFRLDYAFAYPYQIKDTWGSHRFSLTVRW
jgi:hypothetical protein